MNRILIRCDASLLIGSGHVMRCRTLARELRRHDSQVTFLCRRQPGDLINLLAQDFEVLALPSLPLVPCEEVQGRNSYDAWLGCTQEEDAEQCLAALAEARIKGCSWIVVDHYALDALWEEQLLLGFSGSDKPPKLLVIDDLADRSHRADLLLDQNFFSENTYQRYSELVPPHCRQLLGPHYALLGPEYAQLHPIVPPRNELRRLLVFFGGVDPFNLTGRTLEALMDPAFADLAVDVILGLQSSHHEAVAKMVANRPNTTLHAPLPSLAGLIARADLAIGAGGATTWERACLGLPSLVVTIATNQMPFSEALDQAGHIELLGDESTATAAVIRAALLARIADPRAGNSTTALTDGWGAPRLAMSMLGPKGEISLRTARATDEAALLNWANNPLLSADSYMHQFMVTVDNCHLLQKEQEDPNRILLIATAANGCPIGQILLDRQECSADAAASEVKLHLFLDSCARGHGLAAQLVRKALEFVEQCSGLPTVADTYSHYGKTAGHAFFVRAGLTFDSEFSTAPPPVSSSESLSLAPSRITLLTDSRTWLNAFLSEFILELWKRGHSVRWIHSPSDLRAGDVCLLLSCQSLLTTEQLELHQHNLVVHASALPRGQGWSPMSWQILEGASSIPLTLFEAVADLDAGPIYLQQQIDLQGSELAEEWRVLLAQSTSELCLAWFDRHKEVLEAAQPQQGEVSHYPRRRPADSMLDPEMSLAEQFNLLRVVDNQSYPAYFHWLGRRYTLNLTSD